ncbi:hypothetical protein R3P38DRAFT_3291411 [Favolaschia claudopus]|uniref:Uncharacterized protein n=1 Tax=Favolaschia claudopus TaxID=2862362 RepID=A0AAV9ZNE1_9AGAR
MTLPPPPAMLTMAAPSLLSHSVVPPTLGPPLRLLSDRLAPPLAAPDTCSLDYISICAAATSTLSAPVFSAFTPDLRLSPQHLKTSRVRSTPYGISILAPRLKSKFKYRLRYAFTLTPIPTSPHPRRAPRFSSTQQ